MSTTLALRSRSGIGSTGADGRTIIGYGPGSDRGGTTNRQPIYGNRPAGAAAPATPAVEMDESQRRVEERAARAKRAGSTMLTGPSGISSSLLNIGTNTLLGY